jgi:hypothetical protein
MRDFGSYSDLLRAPASLVQRITLLYSAEAQHAEVKKWEAEVDADWRRQGLL